MRVFDRLAEVVGQMRTEKRNDSWVNVLTGFGTARDRTNATTHIPDPPISDNELTSLFNHNDMARKVVTIVPREMMRQGYTITSKNVDASNRLIAKMRSLDANTALEDGITWGRLYGGAVMFVGANDGQPADQPLREDWVSSVDFLEVYDRRSVYPSSTFNDVLSLHYGKPEVYTVNTPSGGISQIHASRLIRFGGARTDARTSKQLQFWDYSVLQAIYRILAHFDEVFQASRLMMSDASQAVFKLKGLIAMIAGGQKKDLETRAILLDTLRSVSRAIFLDADAGEDFSKIATQFAGVSDVLVQTANRLAAATEIPVTLLMGQAPAGLNATGASDIRIFYDLIRSFQENVLREKLQRLIHLTSLGLKSGNETFNLSFNSLWQETPQELAQRRLTIAQADIAYIGAEVYTSEEVAKVRSQSSGWDSAIVIDPMHRDPIAGPDPSRLAPPGPKPPAIPVPPLAA